MISYSAHGRRRPRRVCERVHRHRARGRPRDLCARSSRKADRLRVALRTRNDREGQGRHPAFYGSAPRLSYWNGCSTGGTTGPQGSADVPEDYDGIIAGAPANRTAISLWIATPC